MKLLLLQGPVGSFFAYLAREWRRRGHSVRKIDFNGGDWFFSLGSGAERFSGTLEQWTTYIAAELERDKPDALIVFGDERPLHGAAIAAARAHGVAIFSFEEGYFRPNHVTFEPNGNNANSPIPREPAAYGDVPEPPAAPALGSAFGPMARCATLYYCARTLASPFIHSVPHHRERDPFSEGLFWARSFARKFKAEWMDRKMARQLLAGEGPGFFLAALQVHDDLQLRHHGGPWHHSLFIAEVTASFAAHAPKAALLVFKVHPLDRGHRAYRWTVMRAAAASGVADRVITLETGALGPMVRHARGLITVNSTSGLTALMAGVPVAVLGKAFYTLAGLATRTPERSALDGFWAAPPKPDPVLAERFARHILTECLIPGSFYLRRTWPRIAAAAEARIVDVLKSPPRP